MQFCSLFILSGSLFFQFQNQFATGFIRVIKQICISSQLFRRRLTEMGFFCQFSASVFCRFPASAFFCDNYRHQN